MRHDVASRYIRRNHSRELPKHILALDTETSSEEVPEGSACSFRMGWTARCLLSDEGELADEDWRFWQSADELLDYLEATAPRDGVLWVFANNIYFDLQALGFFRSFTDRGWVLDFTYDSQSTFMLIIKRDRYTIKALSVSNYWAASTRELGELLGRHKADPDLELIGAEDLACYCFRDTEIALDIMARYFRFIRSADLGSFRLSRAAQAYGAWRHRFMRRRVAWHEDPEVRSLEESAYTGGRVEAYRIGALEGGPFACYDVNSMYPFIMRDYRLPDRCVDYHEDLTSEDAADILIKYSVIAEATLDTDAPLYAYRFRGKLIYPVGRFDAFLCTEGLRQAYLRGHLVRVKRLAAYTDTVLFREYVDYFYELKARSRASGDRVTERTAKLLLNSLYGKLGQRCPVVTADRYIKSADYSRQDSYDMVTHTFIVTTRMFHREIVTEGSEPAHGTVLSIPAHITEYGRMLLFEIQERIGRERVLYCDTDSVFIPDPQGEPIGYPVSHERLGALSMKWSSSSLSIWGAKYYENDSGLTLKGVPSDAVRVGPRSWSYDTWPGMRTHLQAGESKRYILKRTVKVADDPYDKGQVLEDGRVIPWKLPDLLRSSEQHLLSLG